MGEKQLNKFQWAVISGMLVVMAINISILMPILLGQNIKDFVRDQVHLDLKTQSFWTSTPGKLGVSKQKVYQLYNLTNNLNEKKIKLENKSNALKYKVDTQMQNISFVPNTNSSIQYLLREQMTLQKGEQANKIRHINLNLLKGFQEEKESNLGRTSLIAFNQIMEYLREVWVPYHLAYVLISNDLASYDLAIDYFKSAGITDIKTQQTIYNHHTYGWNKVTGLQHWVQQSFLAYENRQYTKQYSIMKKTFSLTEKQMSRLIKDDFSTDSPNAKLLTDIVFNNIIAFCAGEWNITPSDKNNQKYRRDMAINQFSQSLIGSTSCMMYYTDPYTGADQLVADKDQLMNNPVEFKQVILGQDIQVGLQGGLLDKQAKSSLYDLDNMRYLVNQNNNDVMVRAKLAFDIRDNDIDNLRLYLNTILDQLLLGAKDGWKMDKDQRTIVFLGEKALERQFNKIVDNYRIGVFQEKMFKDNKDQCEQIMSQMQELKRIVCGSDTLDFTKNINNMRMWVDLMINLDNSNYYKTMKEAGVTDQQLKQLFSNTNQFGQTFKSIAKQVNIWKDKTCSNKVACNGNTDILVCDEVTMALQQWGGNKEERNNNYKALNTSNVFIQKANQQDYQMTELDYVMFNTEQEIEKKRIEYLNSGQVLTYKALVTNCRNDKAMTGQLFNYIKRLVVDVVFEGLYQITTQEELLTDLPYYYVSFMKNYLIEEGGYKYKSTKISLQTLNNNEQLNQLATDGFDQMSSGLKNVSTVKKINKVRNTPYISYIDYIDNGKTLKLEVNACQSPAEEIKGTDGNAFQPFLTNIGEGESLHYYQSSLYQSIQLTTNNIIQNSQVTDLKTLDYNYVVKDVDITKYTNLPILISNTQQSLDQFQNVYINNKKYSENGEKKQSFMSVEIYSGITYQKQEYLQYNVIVQNKLLEGIVEKSTYPLFTMHNEQNMNEQALYNYLEFAYSTRSLILTILTTFIIISVILVLLMVCLMRQYYKEKRTKEELVNPLITNDY